MVTRLQRWVGYEISAVDGRHERYLPGNERVLATGQRISGVFRRGKYIIFQLEYGALLAHNAMSGYWDSDDDPWTFDYVEGARTSKQSDIRATLLVCMRDLPLHTARVVMFHDARKFGSLRYLEPEQLAQKLGSLGPDVLETVHIYDPSAVLKEENFLDLCARSRHPIKQLLMEQNKLAGVGNIYAAEGCWAAQVDPRRIAGGLYEPEAVRLYASVRAVMERMIDYGIDYKILNVYRRQRCPVCKTAISSEEIKGRNTWWCPQCQK